MPRWPRVYGEITAAVRHRRAPLASRAGQGTTFTLYFPATREKAEEETPKILMEQYKGHEESVLVVDDIEGQKNVATALLMQLGYQVHSVSSDEDAVKLY